MKGLGKLYHRGLEADPGLRHALEKFVRSPLSVFRRPKEETFWALKDVSLEVKEGEVLGLIGRNGAGKTTLLKILSRITRPTAGWAEIHGRVGSLLEVGTGFHPELTGRENTFLSGAILGMARREIARKFDEIVAFAELEKFIDTPVKHYSSGMYVRLAFAVAAHLEPEILLVDEVLAVGDINFQKKCLGKMGDVAREGRTVVLVSHQLNQIRRLCHRVVWIDAASVRRNGPTHEVVAAYESAMACGRSLQRNGAQIHGKGPVSPLGDRRLAIRPDPRLGHIRPPCTLKFFLQVNEPVRMGHHGIALYNQDRQLMWGHAADDVRLSAGANPRILLRLPHASPASRFLYLAGKLVRRSRSPGFLGLCSRNDRRHEPVAHKRDEWAGVLNIPSDFSVLSKVEKSA